MPKKSPFGRKARQRAKVEKPQRIVFNPTAAQAPAANLDAVMTLPASAGHRWELGSVRWSYSDVPVGGKLTVQWTDTGSVVRSEQYDITAGGPGFMLWSPALTMPSNVAPTVTLAAGGGGVFGKIYGSAQRT